MARPNDFVNRFRYAILAVLIIATIGYGYYLYRIYVPAQPPAQPPSIAVAVLADGSVQIEGVTYSSPATLKLKLAEIEKVHPGAGYSIKAPRGENFNGIAKAVVLLQASGAKTIWVINEPLKKGELETQPQVGFITEPRSIDNKK